MHQILREAVEAWNWGTIWKAYSDNSLRLSP